MTVLLAETNSERVRVQKWTLGPLIHAYFTTQQQQITQIKITSSETFRCTVEGDGLEEVILEWMDLYAKRQKGPALPLELNSLTPFTRKGLKAVSSIKMGDVASYGEIASLAGCPNGARAIGNVCNKNPFPLVIPCHRVIQGDGSIGGFAYHLKIKKALLTHESSHRQL